MKVLLLTSNISCKSGVSTVLMNYIRCMSKLNVIFSIIHFDESKSPTFEDELKKLNVEIYHVPRKKFFKNLYLFAQNHFGEYDILHINDPYLSFGLLGIKSKLGVKKIIFHSHSTKFSDKKINNIRNKILSIPSRFIADHYFACSQIAGEKVFGHKFILNGTIIYNAFDIKKFKFNLIDRINIRKKLNIDNCEVIGHIGNMTPPKNHLFLIDVFAEYLNYNPNAILLLIGDGYLKDKIIKKVNKLSLDEKVIFTGVVNNPYSYMSAMDKFVFPSIFEGLGNVLVEAQINGISCEFSNVIPLEANINSTFNKVLSLKSSGKVWAHELSLLKSRFYKQIDSDIYNINKAAIRLKNIYEELINEKE